MAQVCPELHLGCTITNERIFRGSAKEDIAGYAIPTFCLYYHDTALFNDCTDRLRTQYAAALKGS